MEEQKRFIPSSPSLRIMEEQKSFIPPSPSLRILEDQKSFIPPSTSLRILEDQKSFIPPSPSLRIMEDQKSFIPPSPSLRIMEDQKKFGLLLATKDSDYVKEVYNGYVNVFMQAFGEEGDKWDLYRVVEDEFPDVDDLNSYNGFVISGSLSDAYGTDPWVLKLRELLQTLDSIHKKVLGVCFGHQVLCQALGGQVGKAPGGWDIGIQKVIFKEDLPQCKLLDGLKEEIPEFVWIIEAHRDEVLELPEGAEVIAFSEKTSVEMFCMGDHILGIQGHPEYTKDILYNIVDRLTRSDRINSDMAEEARARMEAVEPDGEFLQKMCKNFLRGR